MILLMRIVFVMILFLTVNTHASDLEKEQRWADQVVDSIIDGEAVWLNDGNNDFLGIYMEAEENKDRAAIIMHGTGVHPNWQQVVLPLRTGLVEHDWSTLSIQMPVLDNEAEHHEYAPLYSEVAPRIEAAIEFLNNKGLKDIVLIGHSQGSTMAAYYLSTSKQPVKGFVAIGMSSFGKDPRMNGIKSLSSINIPVLDLYGNEDLETVIATTSDRAAAAKKAGNNNFSQRQLTGNHFFDEHQDELLAAVVKWLDTLK